MVYWQAGTRLNNNKYIVNEILGSGGFGVTYKITEAKTDRLFALKTLNIEDQNRPDFDQLQTKFINEAIALASCPHPNIVRVDRQVFEEKGLWCMVMEYIEGEDLGRYLEKNGKLSEAKAIAIITKVGEALSSIHQKGFLHRDIKPANILLRNSDSSPVLIDFGLAREYTSGTIRSMTNSMTECYAPIEQYQERGDFGAWTDVYALAATLYVLVTKEVPFPSKFRTHAELPSPKQHNPELSDRINEAILKGMEIESQNRPQSMEEWLNLLEVKTSGMKTDDLLGIGEWLDSLDEPGNRPDSLEEWLDSLEVNTPESAYSESTSKSVELLTEPSDDAKFYRDRAGEKFDNKAYQSMIADYAQEIRLNPEDPYCYFYRGDFYNFLKDYQSAIADYTQAIRLNPEEPPFYKKRGNAYKDLKDYQSAIADYTQAIRLSPENQFYYINRGHAHLTLKDYQSAIADFNKAIRLNPEYDDAYNIRGKAYHKLKDYQSAIADYDESIRLNPENQFYYINRGNAHLTLKYYQSAIADFNKAIQLNPEYDDAYNIRGAAHYELKDYQSALTDYSQAIQLNPEKPVYYYDRGFARVELGDYEGASKDIQQAKSLNPKGDFSKLESKIRYFTKSKKRNFFNFFK